MTGGFETFWKLENLKGRTVFRHELLISLAGLSRNEAKIAGNYCHPLEPVSGMDTGTLVDAMGSNARQCGELCSSR